MTKKPRIPHKFQPWIDARKRFHLTDAHIQMARELGLSPKRFSNYADRKNKPWKLPLTQFIEVQYEQKFGKSRPEKVTTIEEMAAAHVERRAAKKEAKASLRKESEQGESEKVEAEKVESEKVESAEEADGQPQPEAPSDRPSED